jgi:cytochrome c biogenesis protein CcmG/thiol:disulfide interchange protein DsbE
LAKFLDFRISNNLKIKKMKNVLFLLAAFVFTSAFVFIPSDDDQRGKTVPSVKITDMNNKPINTSELGNEGKPVVISFWATWCSPCKRELNAINDLYDEWQEETGVKLIAVSIDDERTKSRVKPYINTSGWDFDIWMDTNHDFKRAMGVNNVPHTFLIDGDGKIVYSHNNYSPGDEHKLYKEILKLKK